MSNEIIQNDNGNLLELSVTDNGNAVDLTNATVEALIRIKSYTVTKPCSIADAVNGKCQLILDSSITAYEGVHSFQISVTFLDGRTFSSGIQRYSVKKKIGVNNPLPPPPIQGGVVSIADSVINGNIVVNGTDVKVYDDATLNTDVADLKNSKHTHTNISALSLISTDGTNLLFNGSAITISNSQVLNRFGISTNGNLTIDGIEKIVDDTTSPIDGGTFTSTYTTNIVDGGEF